MAVSRVAPAGSLQTPAFPRIVRNLVCANGRGHGLPVHLRGDFDSSPTDRKLAPHFAEFDAKVVRDSVADNIGDGVPRLRFQL